MKSTLLIPFLLAAATASPAQEPCPISSIPPARAAQMRSAFLSSRIIPDIIPDFSPTTELTVHYATRNEDLGNTFSIPETLQPPLISFPPEPTHNPHTTKYTYIQLDPDAPSPDAPLFRSFLHHIVYDMQPDCIADQAPRTQVSYMAPTPLSVAPHRYVSLVYRQPGNYTPPEVGVVEGVVRTGFDLGEYVGEGGLVLVGGNFMREGLGMGPGA